MSSRIYLVADSEAGDRRLVRAKSQSEAVRHVTGPRFRAWVPDQEELASALIDGVKIETADAGSESQQADNGAPA